MDELTSTHIAVLTFGMVSMFICAYLLKGSKKLAIIFGLLGLILIFPVIIASQIQQRLQQPTIILWGLRILVMVLLGIPFFIFSFGLTTHPFGQLISSIIGYIGEQPTLFSNGILETPEFKFQLLISWPLIVGHALLGIFLGTLLFQKWGFYCLILALFGAGLGIIIDAFSLVYSAVDVMNYVSDTSYKKYVMKYSILTSFILLSITFIFSRLGNKPDMTKTSELY